MKINRLLTITLLPLSQAANLVAACLKILNATVNSTLASNIPPSLTSDIWSTCESNLDSYFSCTMHIVTKDFKLQSYSLGALPLRDLPHNQEFIFAIWLRNCADMLGIDSDCMQPVINTDEASNMVAAGCHASSWFLMWCICHILHLAVQAGCRVRPCMGTWHRYTWHSHT